MNNRKIQNVFDEGLLNNKLDALWVYRIFFFFAMYSIEKVVGEEQQQRLKNIVGEEHQQWLKSCLVCHFLVFILY